MSKYLVVGDVHATEAELTDCQSLMDGIKKIASRADIEGVIFLGDMHHNHALIHVEVMAFWRRELTALAGIKPVVLIPGNHDMPGDVGSGSHALLAYEDIRGVTVVTDCLDLNGMVCIPYQHSAEAFLRCLSATKPGQVVLCHQTVAGSTYENGFCAKDGVDIEKYGDRVFIGGHIHTPQKAGPMTYIGSPRWRTVSDAGHRRGLGVLDAVSGSIVEIIDTSPMCEEILHVVDRQTAPAERPNKRGRLYVDIHGDVTFVEERCKYWAGARVRTFPAASRKAVVRESMGIQKALQAHLTVFVPKYGTPKETLTKMVSERVKHD